MWAVNPQRFHHPSPSTSHLRSSSVGDISEQDEVLEWPGTFAIVHSYISYKAEREQEKLRLEKWSSDLLQEREELEFRAQHLSDSITACTESRSSVLARQREMEASIKKMRSLVQLIRGIQLPVLPQFLLTGLPSGNSDPVLIQQPNIPFISEDNQHSIRKNIINLDQISDAGCASADLRDAFSLNKPRNINCSIPVPETTESNTNTKNSSTNRWSGLVTTNFPALSNTHHSKVINTGLKRTRELDDEHNESKKQNIIKDLTKNSTEDVNESITGLRGTADPRMQTVMSIAEVVQGVD